MRKTKFTVLLLMPIVVIVAVNCGGGGNNGAHIQPTQAVLKLSTTAPGPTIAAIDVTVQLPAGAMVRDAAPSGVAAAANPLSVVNPSVPGTVRIAMITVVGFGTGEFFMVNCDIASGSTPGAADFLIVHFNASDSNGRAIDGLAPVISVEMH